MISRSSLTAFRLCLSFPSAMHSSTLPQAYRINMQKNPGAHAARQLGLASRAWLTSLTCERAFLVGEILRGVLPCDPLCSAFRLPARGGPIVCWCAGNMLCLGCRVHRASRTYCVKTRRAWPCDNERAAQRSPSSRVDRVVGLARNANPSRAEQQQDRGS